MSLREKLDKNPAVAMVAAGILVVLAGSILVYAYRPARLPETSKAFFSSDDGQTWFTDSAYLLPPFDHDGAQAVSAVVFSGADGGKPFCGYLTRYTPEGRAQLSAAMADAKARSLPPSSVQLFSNPGFLNRYMEVRAPGPGKPWVRSGDPRASEILSVRAPNGSAAEQVFVY
jgi:hypothetical protein